MKKIIIIGAGGHSKVVADIILNQEKYEIVGLIDNTVGVKNGFFNLKVLGSQSELHHLIQKNQIYGGVVAIGDNYIRSTIVKKIKQEVSNFKFINCIHPKSTIASDVTMGEGNVIMAGATINSSTELGSHCIINTNSSIDHDNKISDFSSIAPNSACGGNVTIGEFSAIGIGASVKHNIAIGFNCIIGANSFVDINTKSNAIYYGISAKYIRDHVLGDQYL